MPSSISSSSERVPRRWPVWRLLGALLVLAALAGASEAFWRARGFQPSVIDNPDFWSLHRMNATAWEGRPRLVICGSSRAQEDIDPEILQHKFPGWTVEQLAIGGNTGMVFAQELCDDPDFNGLIVLDTTPVQMLRHFRREEAAPFLDCFHNYYQTPRYANRIANTWLRGHAQASATILSTELRLDHIVETKGDLWPDRQAAYLYMTFDRFRPVDLVERLRPDLLAKLRQMRIDDTRIEIHNADPITSATWPAFVASELTTHAERLRARGGQMILVRMPQTGEAYQMEAEAYPRAQFWNRIEPLSGIPTLHFRDDKVLRSFKCPDTSHVDAKDTPKLTRRLAKLIQDKLGMDRKHPRMEQITKQGQDAGG